MEVADACRRTVQDFNAMPPILPSRVDRSIAPSPNSQGGLQILRCMHPLPIATASSSGFPNFGAHSLLENSLLSKPRLSKRTMGIGTTIPSIKSLKGGNRSHLLASVPLVLDSCPHRNRARALARERGNQGPFSLLQDYRKWDGPGPRAVPHVESA